MFNRKDEGEDEDSFYMPLPIQIVHSAFALQHLQQLFDAESLFEDMEKEEAIEHDGAIGMCFELLILK